MTARLTRPRTIHEISRRSVAGEQGFDPAVREFLDVFYSNPDERNAAIARRPLDVSAVKDAYLSAVAEHLARLYGLQIPPWSDTHGHGLRRPFFAGGMESMKALLTVQSPTAFRRRMLFVSRDALDRPRQHSSATEAPQSGRPSLDATDARIYRGAMTEKAPE